MVWYVKNEGLFNLFEVKILAAQEALLCIICLSLGRGIVQKYQLLKFTKDINELLFCM